MVFVSPLSLLISAYSFLIALIILALSLNTALSSGNYNHFLSLLGHLSTVGFGLAFIGELYFLQKTGRLRKSIWIGILIGLSYIGLQQLYQIQCNQLETSYSFTYQQYCSQNIFRPNQSIIQPLFLSYIFLIASIIYTSIGMHFASHNKLATFPILLGNKIKWSSTLKAITIHLLVAISISIILLDNLFNLFTLTNLQIIQEIILPSPHLKFILLQGWIAAFWEEIVFRLGIQNYLTAKLSKWPKASLLATTITTFIWALMHAQSAPTTQAGLIRIIQIIPQGFTLGYIAKHHGLESSIIAHGLFNTLIVLLLIAQF